MTATVFSAIFTTLGILILKRYAPALRLIDVPNSRSIHTIATPRGAGITFFPALIAGLAIVDIRTLLRFPLVFSALALVWGVGVLDDIQSVSPKTKFIASFIASTLLFIQGIYLDSIGTYLGYEIVFPPWLAFGITVFAVSGYTNALNLIDGLDGLAAVVSSIIFLAFASVGYLYDDSFLFNTSVFMIIILIFFTLHNWHPATIFMGDSGSLFIGLLISTMAIYSTRYLPHTTVLFIIALPVIDTIVVILKRKRMKKSIFCPDKNHIHHSLYRKFRNVPLVVLFLGSLQAFFIAAAFILIKNDPLINLALFLFILSVFYCYFKDK